MHLVGRSSLMAAPMILSATVVLAHGGHGNELSGFAHPVGLSVIAAIILIGGVAAITRHFLKAHRDVAEHRES